MTTTAELTGPAATTTARRNAQNPGRSTGFSAPEARTRGKATLDTPNSFLGQNPGRSPGFCPAGPAPQPRGQREAAIQQRLDGVPPSMKQAYLATAKGIASPRQAIRMFCLECVCYDRREVALCTSPACPLWLYRFGKRPGQAASPAEAAGKPGSCLNGTGAGGEHTCRTPTSGR